MDQNTIINQLFWYLEQIRSSLNGYAPKRDFNALRYTLAAGASQIINIEVVPRYYAVVLDQSSAAGANLEIYSGEFIGFPWLTLYPGNMVKFPAKVARLQVRNSGTQPVSFAFIALGDDDFVYIH